MSFKLEVEIADNGEASVNFDGDVNHIVLLGVLESIKHGVLGTADMMAAQEAMFPVNEDEPTEQPEQENAPTEEG